MFGLMFKSKHNNNV